MPFTPQEVLTRIKTHVQRHVKFSTTFKCHLRSQSSEPSAQALRGNLVLQRLISLLDSILLQRRKLFFFVAFICLLPEIRFKNTCFTQFQVQLGTLLMWWSLISRLSGFEKNCKITREKNSSRNLMPPFSHFPI